MSKRGRRSRQQYLSIIILLIVLGIMVLKVGPTLAASTSKGKDRQANFEEARAEVIVQKGDTLWSLAKKHGNPRQDLRIVIAEIQEINELASSEPIYPGQILIIPIR